ncbi:glycosyltransferase [Chloroflexota bacterium]
MVEKRPLLSIVITSNTMERLKDVFELLDSIQAQTYPNIETVFVAEGAEVLLHQVSSYVDEKDMPNIRVIVNHSEPGLASARNLGIEQATGGIIAFIDDDVILFPDWAEEMVRTYDDGSIIGVTGPALPLWEDESMAWFPEEFYWIISCSGWTGWDKITVVRSAWGMNMSFKREAFDVAGNFINNLGYHKPMAEDLELSLRIKSKTGKHILFSPYVKVWHRVHSYRLTWKFIIARAHHIGVSRRLLKRLYPENKQLFNLERGLLKQIVRLLLNIPREFFKSPVIAWNKLSIIVLTTFFVAVGYLFSRTSLDIFERS